MNRFRHTPNLLRAFSLVEVTLALGIISFGMVTMLGLLPLALRLSREAVDTTVEAQIVRALSSELNALDWANFPAAGYGSTRCYDNWGMEVDSKSPQVVYIACVFIPSGGGAVTLPKGGAASGTSNPGMRRAQIFVAHIPDAEFSFAKASGSPSVKSTPVLLVRQDQ